MSSPKSEKKAVFKFMIDPTVAATVKDVLLDRGWIEVGKEAGSDWSVYWCEVTGVREALDACRHGSLQRIPHFRNNYELTTKNMLYRNMKRHRRALLQSGKTKEAELCDCVPIIFELPAEFRMFVEEYRKSPGSTWIVKPARGSRGRGIFLFNKLKELTEWREQQSKLDDQDNKFWLIQRYVHEPYLIGGRKFDLRIYVLVTSYTPLRVWMAREGFARICGSQYSLDRLQDTLAHLTNSALQIPTTPDPSNPAQQGSKWSLLKLRQFLSARHGTLVVSAVFDHVARQVLTTLAAVQSVIMRSPHAFELYGYDVLFDQELTPWMLEVNASPTLSPTSLEDYQLKYNMIEDIFHILDYEQRLTGGEIRVGGFDLIWNDGAVHKPTMPNFCNADDKELNSFLGCHNDRDENLKKLHILKKFISRCTHEVDVQLQKHE